MKIFKNITLILLAATLLTSFVGCSFNLNKSNKPEGEIAFSQLTQQERKDYISNFLYKNYNLNCDISEVKQKQINAIENEDFYFAIADAGEDIISVWISKEGEIIDSYFMLELSDCFTEFFSTKVKHVITEFKIKTYSELRDIPTQKITPDDDIENYLQKEPVFTYVHIFVDGETISEENINQIKNLFTGYDVDLYIHVCEDIDNVDIDTYDLSLYDHLITVRKD